MYRLLAKQHKNYVTPFSNGYHCIESDGDWDIILIDECITKKSALISIENILSTHFNADFDTEFNYYVNEELVYSAGDDECIINGIRLFVVETKSYIYDDNEWEELDNPIDDNISIFIKENDDYGFDVKVDDKYLLCLASLPMVSNKLIGRKVFWLDPTALRGEEHTSGFYTIQDIVDGDSMIIFSNDTEVMVDECYI